MAPGHEYGNWLTLHGVKSGQIQIHSEGVGHRTSIDDMGVLWLFLCIYACEGRDSQMKNKTTTCHSGQRGTATPRPGWL